MTTGKTFSVKVEEVHSGDDFILLVDLGVDGLYKRTRARLFRVDAPNAYRAKQDTEAGKVRDEVRKLVAGKCFIELVAEGKGGWIVEMHVQGEGEEVVSLNQLLVSQGYEYHFAENHQGKV